MRGLRSQVVAESRARGVKRFRWLNDRDPCRYEGRACLERKGQKCRCRVLPLPGAGGPKNVLIEFEDGHTMVVPHGTVRRHREG